MLRQHKQAQQCAALHPTSLKFAPTARNHVECVAWECHCTARSHLSTFSSRSLFRCRSPTRVTRAWSHYPTLRKSDDRNFSYKSYLLYVLPISLSFAKTELRCGKVVRTVCCAVCSFSLPICWKLELMSFLSVAPSQKRALKMASKGGRAALSLPLPLPLSSPSSFRDKK